MDDTFLTYAFKKPEYIQESAKTPFSDFIGINNPFIDQGSVIDYNIITSNPSASISSNKDNDVKDGDSRYYNITGGASIELPDEKINNKIISTKQAETKPFTKKTLSKKKGHTLSMSEFKKELLPDAKRVAERLKVEPDVILAQAFLESGGDLSKTIFGIKAQKGYKGKSTVYNTKEQVGDNLVGIKDSFRTYDTISEAFDDYANLISTNRYRSAIGKSPEEYYKIIKKQGYATDNEYVNSLINTYKQMKKS